MAPYLVFVAVFIVWFVSGRKETRSRRIKRELRHINDYTRLLKSMERK